MKSFSLLLSSVLILLSGCTSTPDNFVEVQWPVKDCIFDGGYLNGKEGSPYLGNCSPSTEQSFIQGYAVGRKIRLIEEQIETTQENSKERNLLITKKNRVIELKNSILTNPENKEQIFKEYKRYGLDPVDVNFRWRTHIKKIGGVDELSENEAALIRKEILNEPALPSNVSAGAIYGFGIGHFRQGNFVRSGLKYALIDTLLLGGIYYGIQNSDEKLSLGMVMLGLPLSRAFQYNEVEDYNFRHHPSVEKIRTEIKSQPSIFRYTMSWEW